MAGTKPINKLALDTVGLVSPEGSVLQGGNGMLVGVQKLLRVLNKQLEDLGHDQRIYADLTLTPSLLDSQRDGTSSTFQLKVVKLVPKQSGPTP